MKTLTISIDERTERDLQHLSSAEGSEPGAYAARLLRRAVRAARPKPVFDKEILLAYTQEYAEEESALADSDAEHRSNLLKNEDAQ